MTADDAINVFKEQFCGLEAYCEIHRDGLCLTDGCEVWWAIKALEQRKADIVEVVRCKDCKHHIFDGDRWLCKLLSNNYEPVVEMDDDGYCSYGDKGGE